MIGKVLACILALADISLLALLLTVGNGNVLREAGLATGFLLLGALAWVAAFFSALYIGFRHGHDWRWALILLGFVWLPALPVLAYGIGSVYAFFARRRQPAVGPVRRKWTLPPVDRSLLGTRKRTSRSLPGLRKAA